MPTLQRLVMHWQAAVTVSENEIEEDRQKEQHENTGVRGKSLILSPSNIIVITYKRIVPRASFPVGPIL